MIGTQKIIFENNQLIPVHRCKPGWEPITKVNEKGYALVWHPKRRHWISIHKVVDEYYRGKRTKNEVVHHINFDKLDNRLQNLKRMDKVEHFLYHSELGHLQFKKGEVHGPKHHSKETKKKISEAHKKFHRDNPDAALSGEDHPMYGVHHSKESRKKMSKSRKAYKQSREVIEKARRSNTGRKRTPEQCENIRQGVIKSRTPEVAKKISDANKGRKIGAEGRANMSKGANKRWSKPEEREKMSKIKTGQKASDETRRKMSESHLARPPFTEEHKANIRKAKTGVKASEETKKKKSEQMKKMWQDPEYRKKQSKAINKGHQDEEYKKKMSEKAKERYRNNPELRAIIGSFSTGRVMSNDTREKIRQAQLNRYSNPKEKEKTSKAVKDWWDDRKKNKGDA